MAKRKKKVVHRRRRVGAASGMGSVALDVAGVAGGVFVGGEAKKMLTSIDPKILGAGLIVVGALLPKFVKSPIFKAVGLGLIAKGSDTLLTSLGVISGISGMAMRANFNAPALKQSVGGNLSGSNSGAISGMKNVRDMATVGAMYDN